MKILVTGGAGYIGSHTVIELYAAGHDVVVVDNLSNSKASSLKRVAEIVGRPIPFHRIDLLEAAALDKVFASSRFDAVIHFAGLKAVGESVGQPLRYYKNNVAATFVLAELMTKHSVKSLVFSSSATVYGDPQSVPIRETAPLSVTNPYGRSKLMVEDFLRDWSHAEPALRIAILRYFNPVGAHPSGRIGEDPNGIPNNLVPFVAQVAIGRRAEVRVFGGDYPTLDGTGVRDYIHVVDLAKGHVKALERIAQKPGCNAWNLGTGKGNSVLEVIAAFEKASGKKVPHRIVERRPGDVAACFADPETAATELGWKATLNLDDMCRDSWKWQSNNPDGYPND